MSFIINRNNNTYATEEELALYAKISTVNSGLATKINNSGLGTFQSLTGNSLNCSTGNFSSLLINNIPVISSTGFYQDLGFNSASGANLILGNLNCSNSFFKSDKVF